MASSFLKKKAEEQAKRIDKQYGATAYGGSSSRTSSGGKTGTVKYSPMNYCKIIIDNSSDFSSDLVDAAKALYLYYVEAVKYFS